jgi:hypothetical protein
MVEIKVVKVYVKYVLDVVSQREKTALNTRALNLMPNLLPSDAQRLSSLTCPFFTR